MAATASTISMISIRKRIVVRREAAPPSVVQVDASAAFNDYLKSW